MLTVWDGTVDLSPGGARCYSCVLQEQVLALAAFAFCLHLAQVLLFGFLGWLISNKGCFEMATWLV